MKDRVLKTMTAYVLWVYETYEGHGISDEMEICNNYAKFISQPPQLCDYVACDKDGKPMEKPKPPSGITPDQIQEDEARYYEEDGEYQTALNRCIFVGWEIYEGHPSYDIVKKERIYIWFRKRIKEIIVYNKSQSNIAIIKEATTSYEQIITSGIELELTEAKAKELNLI